MRRTVVLGAAIVLAAATMLVAQTHETRTADEAQIKQLATQYETAWNERNAQRAVAVYTEDAVFVDVNGEPMKGRAAIQRDMAQMFSGPGADMRLSLTVDSIQFLGPDTAIVTGSSKMQGPQVIGSGDGFYMLTTTKVGGEWKVAAAQAAVAPPDPASAQGPQPTGTAGTLGDAEALVQLQHEWAEATKNSDFATLDRIFADEYTFVDPGGALRTKEQELADLRSGNLVFESMEPTDVEPRIYGDTAVVTGVANITGRYKEHDISGRYRWTDTFVKRDGEWKAVASHVTKIMEQQ
jgi:uncharacterized protein (TIGR02246 family)